MVQLIWYLCSKAFKRTFTSFHEQEPTLCCTVNYYYFLNFSALLQAVAGPPGVKGERVSHTSRCGSSDINHLFTFNLQHWLFHTSIQSGCRGNPVNNKASAENERLDNDRVEQLNGAELTFLAVIDAGSSRPDPARPGWRERSNWRKGESDQTISTEGSLSVHVENVLCIKVVCCLLSLRVTGETKVLLAPKERGWVPSRCSATPVHHVNIATCWQHIICRHTRERLVNRESLEKMWVISIHPLCHWFGYKIIMFYSPKCSLSS